MVGTDFMDELDCGSFFDHIDDLLDVPTDDLDTDLVGANGDCDSFPNIFTGCSSDGFLSADSVFSANSASDLSAELSVPYEDIVQLEWLSNFVEDSFSGGGMTMEKNTNFTSTKETSQGQFQTSSPVSVLESCSSTSNGKTIPINHEKKARTKRPRPTTFNPRPAIELIAGEPIVFVPTTSSESGTTSIESKPMKKTPKQAQLAQGDQPKKKKLKIVFPSNPEDAAQKQSTNGALQAVRKCLHCEITKTPQWRAGPMGPKTLCNACGVRYKSGRLFPEYRPAASPTFIPSVHSNSHKKVIEMRTTQKTEPMPEIATISQETELIPRSELLPTLIGTWLGILGHSQLIGDQILALEEKKNSRISRRGGLAEHIEDQVAAITFDSIKMIELGDMQDME
ncbi:hypothetical protein V2J09_001363 [Rumex salicifolius]